MPLRLLLQRDTSALAAFYADVQGVGGGGGGPDDAPRWVAVACDAGTAIVDLDALAVRVRGVDGRERKVQDVDPGAAAVIATCLSRYRKLEARLRRLV